MKNLKIVALSILSSLFIVSCLPPGVETSTKKTSTVENSSTTSSVQQSNNSNTNNSNTNTNSGSGGNDDHNNGTGTQQTSNLPVSFLVSQPNVTMELAQVQMVPITLSASNFFEAGFVDIEIDNSSLVNYDITSSQYINVALNQNRVFLNPNGSTSLILRIETMSMAPSVTSAASGGAGRVVLRASSDYYGAGVTQDFQVNLEIQPKITIGIVSDSVPHDYDQADQIYVRPHNAGMEVTFMNKTMNFGTNGDGPCIHTTSPLRHCNTGNRMGPGDSYTPPVRVMPSDGYRRAIFYNHFNGSDNTGRYIHFNVNPGQEGV